MVFYLLDFICISLFIIINQIIWNAIVFNQFSLKRFFSFLVFFVLTLLVLIASIRSIPYLKDAPFLGNCILWVNKIVSSFYGYLPKPFLFIWFLLPLLLAFVFYILRSSIFYLVKKLDYEKWRKKKEKEEAAKLELKQGDVISKVEDFQPEEVIDIKANRYKKGVEGLEDKEKKIEQHMDEKTFELNIFNLSLTPFSVETIGDFRKAVQLSKEEQILIDRRDNFYAFFVRNQAAYGELRKIGLQNEIQDIPKIPCYLEISSEGVKKVISLKALQETLKRREHSNE